MDEMQADVDYNKRMRPPARFQSLRWRLPLSYALIALLAVVVLGVALLSSLRSYYDQLELDYLTGNAEVIATLNDRIVGVRSGRLIWFGFTLTEAFGGTAHSELIKRLTEEAVVSPSFTIEGDRLVAFRRSSVGGGDLIFLISLEPGTARAVVRPDWGISEAVNAETGKAFTLADGSFQAEKPCANL